MFAWRDKDYPPTQETKILKSINFICQYEFWGFSNIATEFEAIGGNTHARGRYGNNMLIGVRGVDNGNPNGDFVQVFLDIAHAAAVGEEIQQYS